MVSTTGFNLEALANLRRARRLAIVFVVGYLPLGFALFFLDAPQTTGTATLAVWLVVTLLSILHLRSLECPQCGHLFYADSRWGYTNLRIPFTRQCMHCDFMLGELNE